MRDSEKQTVSVNGMGTGYVSLIMIFVAICLTALAALSFSAAGMDESLRNRTTDNMQAFYSAENDANRILRQLDEAAYEAAESGLFMTFEDTASAIEGVTVSRADGGYTASWSHKISDKLELVCEIMVYSSPEQHDNKRYTVNKWETVPAGSSADISLNVWDGTF